jgi:hypothetical protein
VSPPALSLLPGRYAVLRLDAGTEIPAWALTGALVSVTRTLEEVSVVCDETQAPPSIPGEGGWRVLKLHGPFPLDAVGVLASVAGPLADAGISIFVVSTYDTDYVLVKDASVERALSVLAGRGLNVAR